MTIKWRWAGSLGLWIARVGPFVYYVQPGTEQAFLFEVRTDRAFPEYTEAVQ